MSPSLPKRPNLEHLRKSAKQLLAAHKQGQAACCRFLRRLNRFAEASDEEILVARVTLRDTQYIVARHYDFESWDKLRRYVLAQGTTSDVSIQAVLQSSLVEVPDYAGAGELNPYAMYTLKKQRAPMSRERITRQALRRAIVDQFTGQTRELISAAVEQYGRAFRFYDEYRSLVSTEATSRSLHDRLRTRQQIALITPPLEQGIAAEAGGLELLRQAVEAMPPV